MIQHVGGMSASLSIVAMARLPRTGDTDCETGFCFCVLGCPLDGYFARLNTNSRVTPAGVRGFVNFNSSSLIDVTIRR